MSAKVFEWLENLGPGQYAAEFDENDIGVNSTGHRLHILEAAKAFIFKKFTNDRRFYTIEKQATQ